MNALDDLAAFVSAGEAAAGSLQAKLRLHVVDTLAAWVSGLAIAEGRALVRFHNSLPAASAFDDVALACAASRLSEVDDIHLASMTTCGSIVIPAALTLAVALKASPDDLAPAILGGYEAMIRLGLTIEGPDVLYRGIWPTYFGAPFGAAAVAARLLELDAKQTGHALAFALTLAAPSVGQHHAATTSRWLSVGQAARHGIAAAYAARDGFTSDTNVLHSRLLPDVFGIEPDLPQMAGGSSPYFMDVSLKPWCAARQTMPATQALRELLDGGVAVSEITEIEAYVLPPHLKMIDHGVRAGDRASHLTSLPYQMAVAALAPRSDLDVAQAPAAVSAELQGFMARITIAADNALLADYPKVWPGRIVVTTSSGRHERSTRAVPGDSAHPFTDAEVGAKFQRLVAPVAGETRARRLFDLGSSVLQHETALSTIVTEVKDLGGDGTEVRR